jgi:hypothetical protein
LVVVWGLALFSASVPEASMFSHDASSAAPLASWESVSTKSCRRLAGRRFKSANSLLPALLSSLMMLIDEFIMQSM